MVVIHVKQAADCSFLFETTTDQSNDVLIRALVEVCNKRAQIAALIGSVRALAAHGPAKTADEQGSDALREQMEGVSIDKTAHYDSDPSGNRTGNGPGPQLAEVLEKMCKEAECCIDQSMVTRRQAIAESMLDEKILHIKGAVTMAYPMGLPPADPVAQHLSGWESLPEPQLLDPDTAQLWVAAKDFPREQVVADRIGKNEKTKVIAKIQNPGNGPPAREPGVSEDERKAMTAHYFKKQEEMKRLAEAEDDDYLNSEWANPSGLKNSLRGVGQVRAPGVRLA